MEVEPKLVSELQESTPNGGRSSSTKDNISSTGKERLSMSMKQRILKETLLSRGISIMDSTRNGRSSILLHSKHQSLQDTMINGDSISTDHSS
jgi:hypothetical protein